MAKCDGGWRPPPRRSYSGQGDFSPCREGPSALARTTSPHPPRRSPGQRNTLIISSGVCTHAPDPDQLRYAPSLTTWLAPCAALRVFFSTTSNSLASSPFDGLEAGAAGKPSHGSRSTSTSTATQIKTTSASAQRRACGGPACVHVRCTLRRVRGATLSPHDFRE